MPTSAGGGKPICSHDGMPCGGGGRSRRSGGGLMPTSAGGGKPICSHDGMPCGGGGRGRRSGGGLMPTSAGGGKPICSHDGMPCGGSAGGGPGGGVGGPLLALRRPIKNFRGTSEGERDIIDIDRPGVSALGADAGLDAALDPSSGGLREGAGLCGSSAMPSAPSSSIGSGAASDTGAAAEAGAAARRVDVTMELSRFGASASTTSGSIVSVD